MANLPVYLVDYTCFNPPEHLLVDYHENQVSLLLARLLARRARRGAGPHRPFRRLYCFILCLMHCFAPQQAAWKWEVRLPARVASRPQLLRPPAPPAGPNRA